MDKDQTQYGIYFPRGTFADKWYSEYLLAMDEPSLSNVTNTRVEIYRFLWLRTFHSPVSIRVQSSESKHILWSKQLDGKGGYEPGKLVVNIKRSITAVEWSTLIRRIERASFWTLTGLELEKIKEVLGLPIDGAFWVIEGVKNGRHHMVDRCGPPPDKFRDCCLYLLELSGLNTGPIY